MQLSILDDEVRVSWRAAVMPGNGGQVIHGYLCKIGKSMAVVRMDHNLPPGLHCMLVLLLPKNSVDEPARFVEARCIVSAVVLAQMQFHITFDWLEMKGDGEHMLQQKLGVHRRVWAEGW